MTSLSYLPILTMAVSAISDDVFCHLRIIEESRSFHRKALEVDIVWLLNSVVFCEPERLLWIFWRREVRRFRQRVCQTEV